MDQFMAIQSVRMSMKHAKMRKGNGEQIDPGWARLGKKMDQLVVYTSLLGTLSLSLSLTMQKLVSHIPEKNSIEIVNDPINEYDPEYHDDP